MGGEGEGGELEVECLRLLPGEDVAAEVAWKEISTS